MDFFDENYYLQLNNIQKLNQKIHFLLIEIQDFEIKKKNNLYFLKIQNATFENLKNIKINILKKYYCKIIKYTISLYFNDKKNTELINKNKNNENDKKQKYKKFIFLNLTNKKVNNFINKNFDIIKNLNNINSKDYLKLIKQYQKFIFNTTNTLQLSDLKTQNYNFYNYFYFNNYIYSINDFIEINKQLLKIKILNIEIKEFFKFQSKYKIYIKKLNNNIIRNNKNINKNINTNKILIKRSNDLVKKYNCILQFLKNQEKKNISTKLNFSKNIYELNIRIELNKQILDKCKEDVNLFEIELKKNDSIKGNKFKKIEQCMICLDDMEYGIITNCNHKFHLSCINSYTYYILDNTDNAIEIKCPLCRQYI